MPQSGNDRNVEIYCRFRQDAPELVAGFMQFGRTSVSELYACLEICFLRPRAGEFRLCDNSGNVLSRETPDNIVPTADLSVISLGVRGFILALIA